ncbi:hypothetical protein JXJ21_02135 [candidate division KSB1 bacterium]|nr:hypothetical protein [candidate division KSB1 bacterium]
MGKAVTTFGNAVGCGLVYKYAEPFGYVNCVKPIGRGWSNNPFYANPSFWNDPVVGEDTGYNPPSEKRSRFLRHAFGTIGGAVYDACIKVDTDVNPDYTPCTESWAIGWSFDPSYVIRVVDANPATETGNATAPNSCFGVE